MNTIPRSNIDELSFEIRGTLRLIVPQAAQAWGAIYKTLYETCLLDFVNCLEMVQNQNQDDFPYFRCVFERFLSFDRCSSYTTGNYGHYDKLGEITFLPLLIA